LLILLKCSFAYRKKFDEHELAVQFTAKSNAVSEVRQEQKVQSIVEDLEEMEQEIPIIEIDETLKDGEERRESSLSFFPFF
jgi:hypothetical protein